MPPASTHGLRKALPSDVAAIVELNRQFHLDLPGFRWDTEAWVASEVDAGRYYVVCDSSGVAGALCLHMSAADRTASIEAIAVRQEAQHQGIAKSMIEDAVSLCCDQHAHSLSVESFDAYGLKSFYEKLGFSACPDAQTFSGQQYHRYTLQVPPRKATTSLACA